MYMMYSMYVCNDALYAFLHGCSKLIKVFLRRLIFRRQNEMANGNMFV